MSKIGFTVFWSVSDGLRLDPSALTGFSFTRRLPRNSHKTALIKAVKQAKKTIHFSDIVDLADAATAASAPGTLRAIHQRYKDNPDECAIAIVVPRVNADGVQYEQALQVTVNKDTGGLVFVDPEGGSPDQNLVDEIKKGFDIGAVTIDSVQFRNLIHREVVHGCSGVSLRAFSGGIYFVPSDNEAKLDELRVLFESLGPAVKFCRLPVFDDDPHALKFVDESTVEAFTIELERFATDLQRSALAGPTRRILEDRAEKVDEIKRKVELYKTRLKEHADGFAKRLDSLCTVIDSHLIDSDGKKTIEGFDLLAELASISA